MDGNEHKPPFAAKDGDLGELVNGRPSGSAPEVIRPESAVPADTISAIVDVIRSGERFLVCSHSRPDGDAVGSMLATGMLLAQMGKRADLVAADRIPNIYRELPGADRIRNAMRVHGPYDA